MRGRAVRVARRLAMMHMKNNSYRKYIGLLLVATGSTAAQAGVITYDFSANITDISEYSDTLNGFQHVNQSSFLDSVIQLGDTLVGSFAYDLDAPLSTAFQPLQPTSGSEYIYHSDIAQQGLNFSASDGINYASSGAPTIIIYHEDSSFDNSDGFYLSDSAVYDATMAQTSILFLIDPTGKTLLGPGIPNSIVLDNYSSRDLTTNWVRASDGGQLQVTASLTALSLAASDAPLAAVPEPATSALMWAGLGVLGVVACRMRRRRWFSRAAGRCALHTPRA